MRALYAAVDACKGVLGLGFMTFCREGGEDVVENVLHKKDKGLQEGCFAESLMLADGRV